MTSLPASILTAEPSKFLRLTKPVYVPAVKPTSEAAEPAITIASPVLFDNVIVLSAFNAAFIPDTASLMLAVNFEYDVARATVSPLIVKVADCEKVPLAVD